MAEHRMARGVGAVLAATALFSTMALATASAQNAEPRSTIPNSSPPWLAHAQHTGSASLTEPVDARVYLAPKGGLNALKNAVAAVSTPGSPQYRHFLTPAQFEAQYEPTSAEVDTVATWLRSNGFTVTGVDPEHSYLSVRGSAGAAQQAFHVSMQHYNHDGQQVHAPSGAASVPDALSDVILSVTGLDSTQHANTTQDGPVPPPAAFNVGRPCSLYFGQLNANVQADYKTPLPKFEGDTLKYAPCGYTGYQLRGVYEGDTNLDGSGVTIATTLWYGSPTIASDIETYANNHGDGSYRPGQFKQAPHPSFNYDPGCYTGTRNPFPEQALDIESAHAMAPGANIIYYGSASCYDTDLVDTLRRVVRDDKAQLVSSSWGGWEMTESTGQVPAYEQVFEQGALEGISFLFSSGDNGDELAASGLKQVDYPASDPYVTAVGGTSTAIGTTYDPVTNKSIPKLNWQTGWGTDKYKLSSNGQSWLPLGFLSGGGGGYSTLSSRPTYQNGVVSADAPAGRAVPDVAMDADPSTGFLMGLTEQYPDGTSHYGEFRVGGTSLSSPLFAGLTALAFQKAGGPIAPLNPTIYQVAKSGAFNDVANPAPRPGEVRVDYANQVDASNGLLYTVRTFDQDSSLTVGPGWDDVTGVGAPNPNWLNAIKPAAD